MMLALMFKEHGCGALLERMKMGPDKYFKQAHDKHFYHQILINMSMTFFNEKKKII